MEPTYFGTSLAVAIRRVKNRSLELFFTGQKQRFVQLQLDPAARDHAAVRVCPAWSAAALIVFGSEADVGERRIMAREFPDA